jgi:hypothetical protein
MNHPSPENAEGFEIERNSKFEARNPKQIQIAKIQNSKPKNGGRLENLIIWGGVGLAKMAEGR